MNVATTLAAGTRALTLPLENDVHEKLLRFLELVHKWNRVYNLTAVREPEKMVTQHVLDSLAVVPHLDGDTILDVGSGAGLPGIPIALARRDASVTLVEANHKKAAFLTQAAIELELENVEVINGRVESISSAHGYDVVISRAFADLTQFANLAGHLVAEGVVLAAMKGVHPEEEIAQLPANVTVARTIPLEVPGLGAERHLVLLKVQ